MPTFSTKTGLRYDDLLPTIDLIYEWMDPAAESRISEEVLELQCTQAFASMHDPNHMMRKTYSICGKYVIYIYNNHD